MRALAAFGVLVAASTSLATVPPVAAQEAPMLAATPPMGWNSWNHYGCEIDEELIRRTADAMVASGLRDAGYTFVNLDDCWHGERDSQGFIQPDPKRFPSGMRALGDYLHERGLKFGIYSDAGATTCAGRPGSQGHEFQDAAQYARWGVDYIKYDWCATGTGPAQRNPREAYGTMARAIATTGRPMILAICEWGDNEPWLWAKEYGQLWRTTGDITNCWNCELGHGSWSSLGVLPILDKQRPLRAYAGPGHWNDPDMMEVGNLPTLAENRSHFAMWAMLAAPLIMGTDVVGMTDPITDILANPRIVAIDQDPLGIPGFLWRGTPETGIWAKPLAQDRWAIAVLNRSDTAREIAIDWANGELNDAMTGRDPKFGERNYAVVDAWTGKQAGSTDSTLSVRVAPRDTAVYLLTPR
ncbi:glycoside hydrolase family 27 protein [Erythrobacter sp. LQ02-29]|uniref:glycoside hydrolase family 27 protein n=1 Tax=Erythrobacter sp. LQ02-29 TaxID=2920384 RepID=UPI001F4D7420|nr:glycoside hydrolase family 27 protein [Erythrobacter sp. LQ02-29]MCP9223535.1 glycoside hydrolase family 27 protein [Erythrobacter sp. LQ02-29]